MASDTLTTITTLTNSPPGRLVAGGVPGRDRKVSILICRYVPYGS